jgi:transposase
MKSKKIDPRAYILNKYIHQTGASVRDVATAIGTTDSTIYCWFRGRKISRLASVALNRFLHDHAEEIEVKIEGARS